MKHTLVSLSAGVLLASQIYAANVAPSVTPPGGIAVADAPMFVCFGFDDNSRADAMYWFRDLVDTMKNSDGSPVRATFFCTSHYGESSTEVRDSWKSVYQYGHEIGNHSQTHTPSSAWKDSSYWYPEIRNAQTFLTQEVGVDPDSLKGWRTPFLEYGAPTMEGLQLMKYRYDCSIESGFNSWRTDTIDYKKPEMSPQLAMAGKNYWWPHTLDNGAALGSTPRFWGNTFPGLWEVPVYTYNTPDTGIVITDELLAAIPDNLKVKPITGFDYNIWLETGTKEGFLNLLKFSFQQRLQGNRSPITLNTHTDYYSADYDDTDFPVKGYENRRWVIVEFLKYLKQFPEVRVVPYTTLIDWMESPEAESSYVAPTQLRRDPTNSIVPVNSVRSTNHIENHDGVIHANIAVAGAVKLTIYSLQGKEIESFDGNATKTTGLSWNLKDAGLAAGTYIAKISGPVDFSASVTLEN